MATSNRKPKIIASAGQQTHQTDSMIARALDPRINLSNAELTELGRRFVQTARKEKLEAQERPRQDGRPYVLSRERMGAALAGVSEITLSAVAAHRLARGAAGAIGTDPAAGDAYAVALQNVAETIARRCDVVAAILCGQPQGWAIAGNFADELDPAAALEAVREARP